ncbi:hypothetical protein BKA57DRAFT_492310 [Linnemannia elongata]|nr:hypothetical protein BKA57DRAFT_492310 [Linnemannia elongata]
MCEPQYQELLDSQIPRARPKYEAVVKVIAGESYSPKSQIYIRTPIMHLDFKMFSNQTIIQTIPETYSRLNYVLDGTKYISEFGHETEAKRLIPTSSPRMVLAPPGSRKRRRKRGLG